MRLTRVRRRQQRLVAAIPSSRLLASSPLRAAGVSWDWPQRRRDRVYRARRHPHPWPSSAAYPVGILAESMTPRASSRSVAARPSRSRRARRSRRCRPCSRALTRGHAARCLALRPALAASVSPSGRRCSPSGVLSSRGCTASRCRPLSSPRSSFPCFDDVAARVPGGSTRMVPSSPVTCRSGSVRSRSTRFRQFPLGANATGLDALRGLLRRTPDPTPPTPNRKPRPGLGVYDRFLMTYKTVVDNPGFKELLPKTIPTPTAHPPVLCIADQHVRQSAEVLERWAAIPPS